MEGRSQKHFLPSFVCMLLGVGVGVGVIHASPRSVTDRYSDLTDSGHISDFHQELQEGKARHTPLRQRSSDRISQLIDTIIKGDKAVSDGLDDLSEMLDRKSHSDDDFAVLRAFNMVLKKGVMAKVDKSTGIKILRAFHLKRPSTWPKSTLILEKVIGALARQDGLESSKTSSRLKASLQIYDAGAILNKKCIQSLIKDPDATTIRLASKLEQDVCCLVVHSGYFAFPDFFRIAYFAHYDAAEEDCTQEAIEAGFISDRPVRRAMNEKGILRQLKKGRTFLFIADKDSKEVYLVLYLC